ALGGADHLPRHLRHQPVPVPLPAWAGPLGHAAEYAGVAPGRRVGGAGGAVLGARLGRPRGDAGAVAFGRRLAGRAGAAHPAARGLPLAAADRQPLLRPAPGSLLEALPDKAIRLLAALPAAFLLEDPGPALAANRLSHADLLERGQLPAD